MDQRPRRVTLFLGGVEDRYHQLLVGKPAWAAERVFDKVFDHAAGEVGLVAGDGIAQALEPIKCGAVWQLARGIDREELLLFHHLGVGRDLGVFLLPPPSGGVEMLESVADRVDPPVALGALWLLLVGSHQLPGWHQRAGEPRQLRHVRRRRRRRIMEQFLQDPHPAFHR